MRVTTASLSDHHTLILACGGHEVDVSTDESLGESRLQSVVRKKEM